jgi:large subunit ribosomal protein L31
MPNHIRTIAMRKDIHPEIHETTITCTCGHVYHTQSTVKNLRIGICAACHPYFTGEQRFVDTAGRVDKFAKRYGSTSTTARRGKPKTGVAAAVKAASEAASA